MPFVVGALGSKPVASRGIGRSGAEGRREPKGRRHAVDVDTREAACGTRDALRIFDDLAWPTDRDVCVACEEAVFLIEQG
jgi:hypothetical protein